MVQKKESIKGISFRDIGACLSFLAYGIHCMASICTSKTPEEEYYAEENDQG